MSVGKLIKDRRESLGLTLEQVGDAVGVKKSTVKKWESGEIENMRRDKIAKLSTVLGINPISLINNEGLTVTELVKITQYCDIDLAANIHLFEASNNTYIFSGLKQSQFMLAASANGIYFNCDYKISLEDLQAAFNLISKMSVPKHRFFEYSTHSTHFKITFTDLPPSIASVRKNDGDDSLVILNAAILPKANTNEEAYMVATSDKIVFKPKITTEELRSLYIANQNRTLNPLSPAQDNTVKLVAKGGTQMEGQIEDPSKAASALRKTPKKKKL